MGTETMIILAAKLCVLLHLFNPMPPAQAKPFLIEVNQSEVLLKVEQVAFLRTGNNNWESDEVHSNAPSIIITTPLGKPVVTMVEYGLASYAGKLSKTSIDVPMRLTLTATLDAEQVFELHLVAQLRGSEGKVIGKVDSTLYAINGGPAFFVLPIKPNKEKQTIIMLKVTPGLLSKKQRVELQGLKNKTESTIEN